MAAISAADVAKLRRVTLAGMMDCKKALEESEGNFEKAIEIIRKKGQAVANKRADKEASEGVVLSKVSTDGKIGAMIVLNSETDFVAKNADFMALANKILDIAVTKNPANLEELKSLPMDGGKIGDKIVEYVGIIGEKLELSYFEKIEAARVQSYIHPGNRLATMVGFTKSGFDEQVYKDIATGELCPVGGNALEHLSKTIILFDKTGNSKRKATLRKHRSKSEGIYCDFRLTEKGAE